MMRGPAPPRFHTGTGTGTGSGSVEREAAIETRNGNGDAPALGTGGGAHGVGTRRSGVDPGNEARIRTGTGSGGAAGVGSEHVENGSARRSCVVVEVVAATWQRPLRPVTHLLMTGLLGSLALTALMVQRRRAEIVTENDVGATGASGRGAGTGTGTVIASTSEGNGVGNGAERRPGVGVGVVARTTGLRVWAMMVETCIWSPRVATDILLRKTGI